MKTKLILPNIRYNKNICKTNSNFYTKEGADNDNFQNSNKFLHYKKLSKSSDKNNNNNLNLEYYSFKEELIAKDEIIKKLQADIKELKLKNQTLGSIMNINSSNSNNIDNSLINSKKSDYANNLINLKMSSNNENKNENKTLKKTIKKLQNENQNLKDEIQELKDQIKNLNDQLTNIKYENLKLIEKIKENNKNKELKKLKSLNIEKYQKPTFPKGEHYYELIKDININPLKEKEKNNNKGQSIQLFFSLNNVVNPDNQYSFKVSIINNKNIGNQTFLGTLENKTGNNIEFGTSFQIDYFFERDQIILVIPLINEEPQKGRGFYLSNLIKNNNNKYIKDINNIGSLCISYIKIENQNNILKTEISSFEFYILLNNKSIFDGKPKLTNIYYVISNFKDRESKRPVYKSNEYDFEYNKKIKTSLIKFESDILCEDKNKEIYFELYFPATDKKIFTGYTSFTLNKLESYLKEDKFFSILIESDYYGNIGVLEIVYNYKKKLTFEQLIKNCTINLDIAIDYTKSNGDPQDPNSLHYIYGEEDNDYIKAIKSCANIVSRYDADQLFPVYGFGGIPEGTDEVSHCFSINFNKDDPNIHDIKNIIYFYKESLNKIKLFYPTYFSHIIRKVINEIHDDLLKKQTENHYYILMILTDGKINDMNETIDCIIEGSKLPLSIIIVGIGNADFTGMDILDGDENPLCSSSGELRKRDIVQSIEFNKFKKNDIINCGTDLAEEVLKEIPRQMEEYYQFCGHFYK